MRPLLAPGVRRLWRAAGVLQLGVAPERAVVAEFDHPRTARILDLLDGTRTVPSIRRTASALDVPDDAVTELLDALADAGLLADGEHVPAVLPPTARRRLSPEACALALRRDGTNPTTVLRRRWAAQVVVSGPDPLVAPIASALAAAGVGQVHAAVSGRCATADATPGGLLPGDTGRPRSTAAADAVRRAAPEARTGPVRDARPSLAVLVGSTADPAELAALRYAGRRVPHLVVAVHDGVASVGPLVRPGVTACLGCVERHRTDRDPAWPALSAQLATGTTGDDPREAALAVLATGYAALQALAEIDGGTPEVLGATVDWSPTAAARRRTWTPHPLCGCVRRP